MCIAQDHRKTICIAKVASLGRPSDQSLEKSLLEEKPENTIHETTADTATTLEHELSSSDAGEVDAKLVRYFKNDLSFQQEPTEGRILLPREDLQQPIKQEIIKAEAAKTPSASSGKVRVSFRLSTSRTFAQEHDLHINCELVDLGFVTPPLEQPRQIPPTPPSPRHEYEIMNDFNDWPENLMIPTFQSSSTM